MKRFLVSLKKIPLRKSLVPVTVAAAVTIGFLASEIYRANVTGPVQLTVAPMLTRVLPAVVAIQAVGSKKKALSLAELAKVASASSKGDPTEPVAVEKTPAIGPA